MLDALKGLGVLPKADQQELGFRLGSGVKFLKTGRLPLKKNMWLFSRFWAFVETMQGIMSTNLYDNTSCGTASYQ